MDILIDPSTNDNQPHVQVLQLMDADLNIRQNSNLQRSSYFFMNKYEHQKDRLLVRRGQEFYLKLEFNRAYAKGTDMIQLVFTLRDPSNGSSKGNSSGVPGRTLVAQVPVRDKKVINGERANGWFANVDEVDGTKIILNVKASMRCLGKWELQIALASQLPNSAFSRMDISNQTMHILLKPAKQRLDGLQNANQNLNEEVEGMELDNVRESPVEQHLNRTQYSEGKRIRHTEPCPQQKRRRLKFSTEWNHNLMEIKKAPDDLPSPASIQTVRYE